MDKDEIERRKKAFKDEQEKKAEQSEIAYKRSKLISKYCENCKHWNFYAEKNDIKQCKLEIDPIEVENINDCYEPAGIVDNISNIIPKNEEEMKTAAGCLGLIIKLIIIFVIIVFVVCLYEAFRIANNPTERLKYQITILEKQHKQMAEEGNKINNALFGEPTMSNEEYQQMLEKERNKSITDVLQEEQNKQSAQNAPLGLEDTNTVEGFFNGCGCINLDTEIIPQVKKECKQGDTDCYVKVEERLCRWN